MPRDEEAFECDFGRECECAEREREWPGGACGDEEEALGGVAAEERDDDDDDGDGDEVLGDIGEDGTDRWRRPAARASSTDDAER